MTGVSHGTNAATVKSILSWYRERCSDNEGIDEISGMKILKAPRNGLVCAVFRNANDDDFQRFYSKITVKHHAVLMGNMSENQPRNEGGKFGEKVN